jgi:hypothetical protein
MSMPVLDQQIVDVLSKSIAIYLHHCDRSKELSPEMIQSLSKQIRRRREIHNNPAISDTEILQKAQEKAFQIYQEKLLHPAVVARTISLNSAESFSLFQSTGGSALDNFLTFALIQERAKDSHDILKMLFKIQFIEDLVPDWDDVTNFLQSEISLWLSSSDAPDFVSPFGLDFLMLHRQWFDMTRKGIHSSQDYRMMQISFVQSIIVAVRCVDHLTDCNRQRHLYFYKECLCTILDMFVDWMDRNIGGGSLGHDPAIQEIGITLWGWSTTAPKSVDDRSNILRRHYPYGQWIHQWFMQCFTVEELVALLQRSMTASSDPCNAGKTYNVLCLLVQEANAWISEVRNVDGERVSTNGASKSLLGVKESDGEIAVWNIVWILSTIRSILCVTRVTHLPWHLLQYSTPDGLFEKLSVDPHEFQIQFWEMFWQMLHRIHKNCLPTMESPLDTSAVSTICTDGMEVLLHGVSSSTQSSMLSNMIDENMLEWVNRFRQRNCDL